MVALAVTQLYRGTILTAVSVFVVNCDQQMYRTDSGVSVRG